MKQPLALFVEFRLAAGSVERFRPLILENAAASLGDEPGCRRFDVLFQTDDPERVVLYEIYETASAFDHHLTTPHFKRFEAATAGMIVERRIERFVLASEASRAGDFAMSDEAIATAG